MECVRTSCGVCFKVGPLSENNGKPMHACIYADYPSTKDYELGEANARLIASAPDLLAALEALMGIVSDSHGVSGYHRNGDIAEWDEFDEINIAIAALAKAKGEQ